MERQGRGLWEEWTREYRMEVMDPVEGEEMGGAVPYLCDRGQGGGTGVLPPFQQEGMRWWRKKSKH